jgi:hypothetical protein
MADHSPDASSAHTPVPFAKTVAIVPPADMLVSDVHFEVKAMHGSSLRSFFSWRCDVDQFADTTTLSR